MPTRTVGRRSNVASRAWSGAFVVSLLISGCGQGLPEVPSSTAPAAPAPSTLASIATGHITPVPMELASTITGAPDLFVGPDGIGLDPQGDLYVADGGNSRIQKLDGEGHPLSKWGSHGSKDGQLDCGFCGLAVDGRGNVYVTDAGNRRVQKFDGAGILLKSWGELGAGNGQFLGPFGIAVDREGNVYVGDPLGSRVQKFDTDGAYISQFGSRGDDNGQFSDALADIAVDKSGNVYVTDRANGVQKFDPDGRFVAKLRDCGDDRLLESATGIAFDDAGNLYVNDLGNHRICKYDASGSFVHALGGFTDDVGLLAVDREGDIYGAEPFANVVLKLHQP